MLPDVILHNGIPFEIKYPEFKPEVIEAMEEEILTLALVDTGTHADLFL